MCQEYQSHRYLHGQYLPSLLSIQVQCEQQNEEESTDSRNLYLSVHPTQSFVLSRNISMTIFFEVLLMSISMAQMIAVLPELALPERQIS